MIEQLDLPIEGTVDVLHIEKRIVPDLNEKVLGEVADIVLAEVPLAQNPAGDDHLGIFMAALTEVFAQVLTVPQPLDIIWKNQKIKGQMWLAHLQAGEAAPLPLFKEQEGMTTQLHPPQYALPKLVETHGVWPVVFGSPQRPLRTQTLPEMVRTNFQAPGLKYPVFFSVQCW